MTSWYGPDGIVVEVIVLDRRPRLRVTQLVNGRRYLVAYCTRVADVARHVDLADLVEILPFPR
ncbi:hypothetical protein [Nonomuraea pusilla]|uniref:Transposase n=1 Tax=Nonomuraea pusilla TaxID=46177 RepID=A0A1H7QEN5_9ACTN|nr:hypothetical protein [Nonomuraea pusilla]SEL46104.1 hypothetical protein SAMN05660976_02512 [Nonomuraea pusilla]